VNCGIWRKRERQISKLSSLFIFLKTQEEVGNVSELHIERDGDQVRVEGEGSVGEIREDLTNLASDLDEIIASPRLKGFAKVVKDYLS